MHPSAARVQQVLKERGFDFQVVEMPASTRTAQDAAQAVGCTVGQIAKSLIFRGRDSGEAILVIASGANRVNERTLAALAGEPIKRADPGFVHARTGFAVGGVPPAGHNTALKTFIDRDLLQYGTGWAAAGTPNAVFALHPGGLQALTGGVVAVIA
jgi:prolyl-tRNA editing enzyme YbaK/EbsC (Cys-tRNA(Pro) deacylase)